jgi:hypothetical protein
MDVCDYNENLCSVWKLMAPGGFSIVRNLVTASCISYYPWQMQVNLFDRQNSVLISNKQMYVVIYCVLFRCFSVMLRKLHEFKMAPWIIINDVFDARNKQVFLYTLFCDFHFLPFFKIHQRLKVGMMDRTPEVRFPAEARDFPLVHSVQTGSGTHPASHAIGTGGCPECKVARAEADHSHIVLRSRMIDLYLHTSSWRGT